MTRLFAAAALAAALLPLTGCGAKLQPVSGSVTLDGKAVAGANVMFTSDDGKHTASGTTDDSGNFTLSCPTGPGAFPGNYKVTVAKYPKVEGGVPGSEGGKIDDSYLKSMKKETEAGKAGPKGPMPGGKGGMPMPPGGMMMPPGVGASGSGVKSELPEVYAAIEKTPLTAKVPADGPVKLELKAKP